MITMIFLQQEFLKIPETNDINDFYKWAIGVLIFVAILAIKFIYMLVNKNDKNYIELKNESKSERDELKKQLEEKNNFIIENFEKNSKSMISVLEKNNFLLENNTKILNSLEHTINSLKDETINSLLHLREKQN